MQRMNIGNVILEIGGGTVQMENEKHIKNLAARASEEMLVPSSCTIAIYQILQELVKLAEKI